MSNGAYVARRVAEELRRHGEAMTLKRTGQADLPVYGKRLRPNGAGSDEITQDLAQTDIIVKISNAEIAGSASQTPPRLNDELVMGGATYTLIADADTRKDGEITVAHFLLVRG